MNDIQNKIQSTKQEITKLEKMLEDLQCNCKHKNLDITEWDTATCLDCGKHFNWYCPTSPNLECDYEHDDGHYDEDDCKYCHEPYERK